MSEIWAIIPARSGSKGVPGKNIRLLGGRPLIEWTIKACKKCKLINRVIFSSDSNDYSKLAKSFGAEAPFIRPKEISEDFSSDFEFINHSLNWFKENEGKIPDILLHMRPTTPFRNPNEIERAISEFRNCSNKTSMRSVHLMSESGYKNFEIDNLGYLRTIFSYRADIEISNKSRQTFKKTYIPNGYIDIVLPKLVLSKQIIHGSKSMSFVTAATHEIDTEEDFRYLEFLLKYNKGIFDAIFN